ncbi:MAG: hypothetical protein JWP31_2276 [Aeromicrobium sp.]|nr:hypothetical protein [Aeromicrobium sp.]
MLNLLTRPPVPQSDDDAQPGFRDCRGQWQELDVPQEVATC